MQNEDKNLRMAAPKWPGHKKWLHKIEEEKKNNRESLATQKKKE